MRPRAGCLQAGQGALADDAALELGQGRKDVEDQLAALVRPQRCPVRVPKRPWRGPHRRSASSAIMRESVAIPAVRQKRSKLAPTSCQASFTGAVASGHGVVIILFMALPFFVEFNTPSLPAQGGQRRRSYFNIERDIPDPGAAAGIVAVVDERHEPAVVGEAIEVPTAAANEGLIEPTLEVPVGGLDRAVLVRLAAVVAARAHAVMAAQRLVTLGQVSLLVDGQIAERRRQAVGTVLAGGTAQPPQGVLQPFGQGREALPAEDDLSVFPATAGEAEVIEAMVKRPAGDSDTELAGVGEVRLEAVSG